jgi:RND superfamily putative drug exporter
MNVAARMGRWSATHRKTAIFGWLAFVVAVFLLGSFVGTTKLKDADAGTGESGRAAKVYADAGFDRGDAESVLVQSKALSAQSPAFRKVVGEVTAAVAAQEGVYELRSPYAAGNGGQISKDGHSALVQFRIDGKIAPVLDAVAGAQQANPRVFVGEFGDASATKELDDTVGKDFKRAEYLSIPLTLAILLLAFGALMAAGVPLLLALTAVLAARGLLAFPSHIWPADSAADSVILLIGLAVGVDYSLFYLRREREERAAGKSPRAALEAAAATSGRAVLLSGMTVLIAMAGMFLTGDKVFTSIAVGTILVVAIAMLGSLTVLPALLAGLGDRIEKGRIPFLRNRERHGQSRIFGAVIDRVLKRPAVSVVIAGGFLLLLTAPAFALKTNNAGVTALPKGLGITKTFDRMQKAFPGGALPAIVVVRGDDVTVPAVRRAVVDLRRRALVTGEMKNPIEVRVSEDRKVASISVPLEGSGVDTRSEHALAVLRTEVVPETVGAVPGVRADVGGLTAGSKDFNDLLKRRAPLVFAFVLGLAFLLLLGAFRSLVIAVKAIVLNLLSVGAAYGLLVAVFQWGWGESFLNFKSTHGITSWLPLFLFVVLFGLSMDYHVFILTRVREAFDRGLTTEDAVAHGIKTTAGTVTSAAVVMVGVFSIFATLSQIEMKQLGVGLAAAILIDATIVRAVLLPATMKLLGRWNWYLPAWLEWLPRIAVEEQAPHAVPALRPAGK